VKAGKWTWNAFARPPLIRHGKNYFIPAWPLPVPEGTVKKPVQVSVKATRLLNGQPVEGLYYGKIPVQAAAQEQVLNAFRESGLFGEVTPAGDTETSAASPARLRAEVAVTVISDWGFYTNSSRYTGGLLPGGTEEIYRVETKLTDAAGNMLGSYTSEERPLYIRSPRFQSFTDPFEFDVLSAAGVGKTVIFDLSREILYAMFSDRAVYRAETKPASGPGPG